MDILTYNIYTESGRLGNDSFNMVSDALYIKHVNLTNNDGGIYGIQ